MDHAGWALFAVVFANQAGIPVPGSASLLAAGALAGNGGLSFPLTLALAVGGTLLADLVWYSLGRWRGARALGMLSRILPKAGAYVHHAEGVLFAR